MFMTRMQTFLITCAIAAGAATCGGGNDSGDKGGNGAAGSCTSDACGGDLTGNWGVSRSCFPTVAIPTDQCKTATVDLNGIDAAGSATFLADNTYDLTTTLTGSESIHWPLSCLQINGITLTCEQLNQAVMSLAGMDMSTIESITCAAEPSGCLCPAKVNSLTTHEQGTYALAGNTITLTPTGAAARTSRYCAKGNTLTLDASNASGGGIGLLVLTKK